MDQATTVPVGNLTFLIKDAKNNQIKVVQATPAKGIGLPFKNAKGIRYLKASEVEALAKEGTIFDTTGQLRTFQVQSQVPVSQGSPHLVAVPVTTAAMVTNSTVVTNAAVSSKMTPIKTEATILPKPIHAANSPMILGTPQRVVNIAASPKTPQNASIGVDQAHSWSGKRPHDYIDLEYNDASKRSKKGEKGGKGLRHFSMKVCEKVQKKGVTSYNEVADELVAEFSDPQRSMSPTDQAYDQKNIRRRVYDALNVLMAMNIISKEKKEIKWLGLPTNSAQECQNIEQEKQKRIERISVKKQQLQDLILQQIAFKNLVQRNKKLEKKNGTPTANSSIHLPFIIVNTSKKTVIDCSISNDKMEYLFNFNNTFEIHDDIEVLKRMGMTFSLEKGNCSPEDLEKAKKLVPKALESYVVNMAKGDGSISLSSGTSIVAGPSGIKTGDSGTVAGNDGSDNRTCGGADTVLQHDAQDMDVEMPSLDGVRRLSRQSSMTSTSDIVQSRVDVATTSDEEDFSQSETEEDEYESMVSMWRDFPLNEATFPFQTGGRKHMSI